MKLSLQEMYAPGSACFGCGPANEKGLHVRSFPAEGEDGEEVVCEWRAEPYHEAYPGMLNGGIVGTLLDCHSNWAAAYHLMRRAGAEQPALHRHRRVLDSASAPDALRCDALLERARHRVHRRARRRRGHAHRQRKSLRYLPRHLRRRPPRPSRLPPLAIKAEARPSGRAYSFRPSAWRETYALPDGRASASPPRQSKNYFKASYFLT